MGTETEYGISAPAHPGANAMMSSRRVVNAYASRTAGGGAGPAGTSTRSRRCATPAASTLPGARRRPAGPRDEDDLGLANVILTNGARLYVDHAHPEYSSPRGDQPARRRAVGQGGRAGHGRGRPPRRDDPEHPPVNLYKNNTDNKGASYGSHENYLMRPLDAVRRHRRRPHAVLRHPADHLRRRPGRASARTGRGAGFQISQRADFFEVEVGLETTLKRPIINTRDEPHADRGQVPPAARHHRRRQPQRDRPPTSRSARPRWSWR